MIKRVLLVDDDAAVREALGQTLDLAGLKPVLAGSYIEAKDHIAPGFDGVVVSDVRMPGKDGFALLSHTRTIDPELPVILLTGEGDVPSAVRGMAAGAFDFLEKPCAPADLIAVVEKALATRKTALESRRIKREIETGDAAARMLVGQSQLARDLRNAVRAAARTRAELLITGGPGSGTSKVAEVVHLLSGGGQETPFLKRAAGALTSAEALRQAIADADGGSLFLDEVAALAPPLQVALIEALEDPGRGARVISGTSRDLQAEVQAGQFNPELFYKLDVIRIGIPALKERAEDIPILFRHYVATACEQAALPMPEITSDHLAGLMAQDWPGNARSLMNAAMRFAMGIGEPVADAVEAGLAEQLSRVERSLLIEALQRHGGRASAAAKALRLPRKTFYDKLARHGLRAEDYRH